jgi:hypothetical protein|tara:strand:- start:113 stop:337 length:225 start_codon:yes stop_codon:yes gene_type:complete
MENVFNYASSFFKGMTSLFMVLLSFGVMAEIVFGSPVFGMSVISNVMDVVNLLGSNGFVGLVVLIILFKFVDQK